MLLEHELLTGLREEWELLRSIRDPGQILTVTKGSFSVTTAHKWKQSWIWVYCSVAHILGYFTRIPESLSCKGP